MSSVSTTTIQESAWFRLVRCLVLLWVAALDRRIARLIARMEALPEDARFDAEFARLDDQCYGLECLRDHYLAWLADPTIAPPRFLPPHGAVEDWGVVRTWVGARVRLGGVVAVGWRPGRCMCALV